MEKTNYRKKTGLFIAVVIIAEQIIRFAVNAIMMNVMPLSERSDFERYDIVSSVASLCITAITIVLTFLMGYILTKDKKKTVIFAGSAYFGKSVAGLLESLISAVAYSLSYAGKIGASDMSAVIFIADILIIPLIIAAAHFAFTAFEGINEKLEGSLDSSEMLLSRAKKRLVVAYLIGAVVSGVMTSAPSLIFALIDIDMEYSFIVAIISRIVTWISTVASFAIVYSAGYKPYKSHRDAMAFAGALGVSNAISGFIAAVVMLPLNIFTESAIKAENYQITTLLTSVTGVVSVIATVLEVILIIYMLKFFFASAKITLFDTAYEAVGTEPAYETETTFENSDSYDELIGEPEPYQQENEEQTDEE